MLIKQEQQYRKQKRMKTIKSGQIIFHHDHCLVKCLVKDLTNNGAKLETEIAIDCPDDFKLALQDGRTFDCFVAWRKANVIGVRFANH